jgi:pimeloyl-ACP methyl ester carboxylesterase
MRASGLLVMFLGLAACDPGGSSDDGSDTSDSDSDATDATDSTDTTDSTDSDSTDSTDSPGEPDASSPGDPDGGTPGQADPVGELGPFDILSKDVTAAGAAATLFAPSSDGGQTIAPGQHPLVVVSPGFQLARVEYAQKARHLASWGFVVLTQDFAGGFSPDHMAYAEQVSEVMDWAMGGSSGIAASVDTGKLAAVGHSMGGKVSMLAAALDERIGAVVGWDPVDAIPPGGGGGISVAPEMMNAIVAKVAVIGETLDAAGGMPCAPAADNYTQYYTAAKSPALEVTVVGGDHMDWAENGGGFAGLFCQKGTATPENVLGLTNRTTTAWLRRHLLGDSSMDVYLTGAVIQADVEAGLVGLRSK